MTFPIDGVLVGASARTDAEPNSRTPLSMQRKWLPQRLNSILPLNADVRFTKILAESLRVCISIRNRRQ